MSVRPRRLALGSGQITFKAGSASSEPFTWGNITWQTTSTASVWPSTGDTPVEVLVGWTVSDYLATQNVTLSLWVVSGSAAATIGLDMAIASASYSVSNDITSAVPSTVYWSGISNTNSPSGVGATASYVNWQPVITLYASDMFADIFAPTTSWDAQNPVGYTGTFLMRIRMGTGSPRVGINFVRYDTGSASNTVLRTASSTASPVWGTVATNTSIQASCMGGTGTQLGLYAYLTSIDVDQTIDIDTLEDFGEGGSGSPPWQNYWAGRSRPTFDIRGRIPIPDVGNPIRAGLDADWADVERDVNVQFNSNKPVRIRFVETKAKNTQSYTLSVNSVEWRPKGSKGFMHLTVQGSLIEEASV